jgi:hypothetical protein
MAKKLKEVSAVSYVAEKVIKRQSKGKTILQFTLIVTLPEGGSIQVRNCILGVGKKGPWFTAPLLKYRPIMFNKIFCDTIIEQFQLQGHLDDLVPSCWTEDEEVEVKWETK